MIAGPLAYRPRLADGELRERLAAAAVLLIEGLKACGQAAKDVLIKSRKLRGAWRA